MKVKQTAVRPSFRREPLPLDRDCAHLGKRRLRLVNFLSRCYNKLTPCQSICPPPGLISPHLILFCYWACGVFGKSSALSTLGQETVNLGIVSEKEKQDTFLQTSCQGESGFAESIKLGPLCLLCESLYCINLSAKSWHYWNWGGRSSVPFDAAFSESRFKQPSVKLSEMQEQRPVH